MKKLPFIEDYIQLMCEDPLCWPPQDPLLKLARYDKPIVSSMSEQIANGNGFTDRQSQLAHKIVTKYKKQWASIGYDVSDHELRPSFRLPIREIDRSRIIDIQDNVIVLRFPYDQTLISHIRASVSSVPGSCVFNKEQRRWQCGLIEPRIIWAKEFGSLNQFEFGPAFQQALDIMLATPDHIIELVKLDHGYEITNAESSLIEYINQNGGFAHDNLPKLLDLAPVCGYTISDAVYYDLDPNTQANTLVLLNQRETTINYDHRENLNIEPIINYARLTNRLPIFVYENSDHILLDQLKRYFTQDQIANVKHANARINGEPVVYFTQWRNYRDRIPLLLTMSTLMIGFRRQQMLQKTEKVIYCTQTVESSCQTVC